MSEMTAEHAILRLKIHRDFRLSSDPDSEDNKPLLAALTAGIAALEIAGVDTDLRAAWEAGFALCRSYGDNHAHFDGEQKERHWLAYLARKGKTA